jgi:hypothetical protein
MHAQKFCDICRRNIVRHQQRRLGAERDAFLGSRRS